MTTLGRLGIPRRGDTCPADADIELLRGFARSVEERERTMIGFPVNLDFDYRPLADFLALHLNNAGSPDQATEYGLDTKPFEQAVVEFVTELAGGTTEEIFGHIAHGGTEANLFAIYVARERYPDAVLYASAQAHYSVPKIARMLRLPHVPVDPGGDGAMDVTALRGELRADRPAIVLATVGSTGGGAIDDIPAIRRAADEKRVPLFVHSDAAFGGLLAAFADPPLPWAFPAGADSVSVSGHKIIGSPIPSSVVLVRRADMRAIRQEGAAVGTDDNTVSGSRDALSPVLLWYALRRLGRDGLARRVQHCLDVTDYATRRLGDAGRRPTRAPGGNVVLFDPPAEDLLRKWHLFIHNDRAHLVVMPHVTREHIDQLCADLTES